MCVQKEILARSHSADEVVLSYFDAMELLNSLEGTNTRLISWEGRILHRNGNYGHSQRFQGTCDLSEMPIGSALALVRNTIMQSRAEWDENPEVDGGDLLFCLTLEA